MDQFKYGSVLVCSQPAVVRSLGYDQKHGNARERLKRLFLYHLGVSYKFYQDNHMTISSYFGFELAIGWWFIGWSLTNSHNNTCNCGCLSIHTIYACNSMTMNSFSLEQVWCTSIGTTIGNGLVQISHLSLVTKAKGHFGLVNSLVLISPF